MYVYCGDNINVQIFYFTAGTGDSSTMSESFGQAASERTSPLTNVALIFSFWLIETLTDWLVEYLLGVFKVNNAEFQPSCVKTTQIN